MRGRGFELQHESLHEYVEQISIAIRNVGGRHVPAPGLHHLLVLPEIGEAGFYDRGQQSIESGIALEFADIRSTID